MKPEWRTSTVVALCKRMLDVRQYDALPILADALQDAGCDHERLLARCQSPALDADQTERLVNIVFSERTAAAVEWLERFVEEIGYHYDREGPHRDLYGRAVYIGNMGVDEGHMQFWTDEGADFFARASNGCWISTGTGRSPQESPFQRSSSGRSHSVARADAQSSIDNPQKLASVSSDVSQNSPGP